MMPVIERDGSVPEMATDSDWIRIERRLYGSLRALARLTTPDIMPRIESGLRGD